MKFKSVTKLIEKRCLIDFFQCCVCFFSVHSVFYEHIGVEVETIASKTGERRVVVVVGGGGGAQKIVDRNIRKKGSIQRKWGKVRERVCVCA